MSAFWGKRSQRLTYSLTIESRFCLTNFSPNLDIEKPHLILLQTYLVIIFSLFLGCKSKRFIMFMHELKSDINSDSTLSKLIVYENVS